MLVDESPPSHLPGPRERLATVGAGALAEAELLALVISSGNSRKPALGVARELLIQCGGLYRLPSWGLGALTTVPGIGLAKACRIVASFELGRRFVSRPLSQARSIRSSKDIDAALRPQLCDESREQFWAVPLDAKNRPIGQVLVAMGGLTACSVQPGDVFRALVREAAAAVVFVHNHPSGAPRPSADDLELTARLATAGAMLGIWVLDHVIVGREGYFSFRDSGLLDDGERA